MLRRSGRLQRLWRRSSGCTGRAGRTCESYEDVIHDSIVIVFEAGGALAPSAFFVFRSHHPFTV